MKTFIIILILLAILLPFCAIAFLYNAIPVNKSKQQAKKISAVENEEIFNHLF